MNEIKIPQFRSYVDKYDYSYLEKVFSNHYIAEGPFAKEFHDELLKVINAKFGCFASNGTLAIYLALKALGIKVGDEVIVQNTTFIASANAVEMVGAKPVFADVISYKDLTIDLNRIKINKNTRAIMLCHLFGTACSNVEEVKQYCSDNGLLLIEDAAQALAIKSSEKHCGTFGAAGTFSFYADKTITTAEGGFVVTDDEMIYEKMLYLRNQGRKKSGTFIHPEIGYNFRMTDIQAALGIAQLSKLEFIINEKQKIYQLYQKYLGDAVEFLKLNQKFTHIPFRVVVYVKDAAKTMDYMLSQGIEPRSVFYPLHQQPCYKNYGNADKDFNNSIECYQKGLCLPTWVGLTEEQIQYVSKHLKIGIDQ